MRGAVRSAVATAGVLATLTLIPGCAVGGEYLVLERFFAASHLRDRTALARFATTVFEPNTDGSVDRFTVVNIGADSTVPLAQDPFSPGPDATRLAEMSLDDPVDPIDVAVPEPALVQRVVTIDAEVRRPDWMTVTRRMQVVLVRARVTRPRARDGRWIVTAFQ